MAGETVGLDLASQTGQSNIESAIEDLADTGGLANQSGQEDIKDAIEGLSGEEGLANQAGQEAISDAVEALASQLATALSGIVLKTSSAKVGSKTFIANGTYKSEDDTVNDLWDEAVIDVPNTYAAGDEGKVVSSGALVSQSSTTKNANGTYDTTLNNEIVVAVPNSYVAGDEGKVVSNGALVAQSARSSSITSNGTYDTTGNNSVTVAIPAANGEDF